MNRDEAIKLTTDIEEVTKEFIINLQELSENHGISGEDVFEASLLSLMVAYNATLLDHTVTDGRDVDEKWASLLNAFSAASGSGINISTRKGRVRSFKKGKKVNYNA